jgi:septal ring factor EnvC (AmiA/AmiB activator)
VGRALLAACLAIVLAAPWGASDANAAPKEELEELRGRLKSLQRDLEQAEESRGEAADALKASERAISESNRKLRGFQEQRREIDQRLEELRRDRSELEQRVSAQREAVGRAFYQQYLAGRGETLRLLLNGQDPNRISRELHYLTYVSRARAELVKSVQADLAGLDQNLSDSERERARLAQVADEASAERERLEKETRERKDVLATLSRQIREQRREVDKLKRDEGRLTKLVDELNRVLARKRPQASIKNLATPDSSLDGRPFRDLKGQMRLPVSGELEHRFGSPREGNLTWKGLFIRAGSGREVKAVAAGVVVFADWLRGFGNLLILDHGQGFMSLYGFNEALRKQVGERVKGGEPVAQVGNTGGSTEAGLYFEIRFEGKPLDPMEWVTLR